MIMVIYAKQPLERELFHVSFPLRLGSCLLYLRKVSFSDLGRQESQEGGILAKSGMRKLTALACPLWISRPPELQPHVSPRHRTRRNAAHNTDAMHVLADDVEVITADSPLWEKGQCLFWFLIT